MRTLNQGSIRLFRLAGVEVFLHWSWFLVAFYEIGMRNGRYSSVAWGIAEYLALFLIVLTHEFGHAMACRQVGGTANRIVLWPLGGVAYVDPPQRPGAMLWSIAAGPLVNVVLFPIFYAALQFGRQQGWRDTMPDAYMLVRALVWIDVILLVFNLLPIYPLDGGKILRSLLWFPLGRARSLMVAVVLGFVGIAGFFALSIFTHSTWYAILSVYMLVSCWGGLKQAQALLKRAKIPRREGFACPSCRTAPPVGAYWKCGKCEQPFDTFETHGLCPHCSTQYVTTMCLDCQEQRLLNDWVVPVYASAGVLNGSHSAR